jgi:ABC-type glycerol-3-phosphate transport system substrate-binding protein
MKVTLLSTLVATGLALAAFSSAAKAEGRLVVYCSATNEMCETETQAFGEKYNVKTSFIRNGSGSTLAKVDAEKKTRRRMSGTAARWIHSRRPGRWDCCSPINQPIWARSWRNSAIRPK